MTPAELGALLEPMLQVHRLEGFYWVAKTGGYAKAARAFPYPITQPGVFAQVRKLEEELGLKLFDRVAKDEMVPTRAGRALLGFCAPFFEGLPATVRAMKSGTTGGELRIDAGPLELLALVPAWMRRLRSARPDVSLRLREVSAPDYGRLLRGETDLVVEVLPPLVPRGIASRVVGTHHAFLAVPKRHRLAGAKRPSAADLAGEAFVAFPIDTRERALQMEPLLAAGTNVDVVATASSVPALLALVGAGLGVSLVVWPSASPPRVDGAVLIPARGRGARFPVSAAYRAVGEADPLIELALGAIDKL